MTEEQIAFLKSYDFMRIGQAVIHGQWQSAALVVRKMEQQAKKLELNDWLRPLLGLRQAVLRKNTEEAKQVLALLVAKRVKLLNSIRNM